VIVLQRAGERQARWTIRDCRVDREALNGNIPGDGVAARIGDTLGASGMASILGATVRTDDAREQTILSKSSLGVNYKLLLEADRPERPAAPRIALMFSGQGSQYTGMLRDIVQERAVAREAMDEYDRLLRAYSLPSFGEMAWDGADSLGSDILRT